MRFGTLPMSFFGTPNRDLSVSSRAKKLYFPRSNRFGVEEDYKR